LTDRGIIVLHNEHRMVEFAGAPVAVSGVADVWSGECDVEASLAGVGDDVARIVLAHNPVTIEQFHGRRCDLMLSGHTHGGQIRFPNLGAPMLSRRMKRYAAGLYQHPSGYLYVNKGIGFTVRFRFNVRPEVAVFEFRPEKL